MHTNRATLSSNYMMKSECFCFKNIDQQWCLQHEAAWCSQGIILLSQMKDKYDLIVFRMKKHYFESVWFLQACWAMLFSNFWHMITFFLRLVCRKRGNQARLELPSISMVSVLPFEFFVRQLQSATIQLQFFYVGTSQLQCQFSSRGLNDVGCIYRLERYGPYLLGYWLFLLWSIIRGNILKSVIFMRANLQALTTEHFGGHTCINRCEQTHLALT